MNEYPLFFTPGEVSVRSAEGRPTVIFGYAALFNERSRTITTKRGLQFTEVIAPGAFDGTDFSAVECRFNHEVFLAAEPTLEFGVDARGLWYQYEHDASDPDHTRTLRRIERREIKGSSFRFVEPSESEQELRNDSGHILRIIKKIPMVVDVGPVIRPAYKATTAFARMLETMREEAEAIAKKEAERQEILNRRLREARAF